MSILIKGMELPKEFDPDVYVELACGIDGKRYARLYNFHQGGLTEWCEAVPVPPHGRLGDLDAIARKIRRFGDYVDFTKDEIAGWFENGDFETIIPAEEVEA